MSPEVQTQSTPDEPVVCPSCGRSDLWRARVDMSGGIFTYHMTATDMFEKVDSSCDPCGIAFDCRGCGLELDGDDHDGLIDALEELW